MTNLQVDINNSKWTQQVISIIYSFIYVAIIIKEETEIMNLRVGGLDKSEQNNVILIKSIF